MKEKDDLIKACLKQLDEFNPDIFFTATFRQHTVTTEAKKKFKYFFSHLNRPQEKFFEKYVYCWAFFELADALEGVHVHALLKRIDPSLAPLLQKKSKDFFGQSKVVAYDHSRPKDKSANLYLAKKIASVRLDDFDFYKINSKLRS